MSYSSLEEIVQRSEVTGLPFWKLILQDQCKEEATSEEECFDRMRSMFRAMKDADRGYDKDARSKSGLSGRDGVKLEEARKGDNPILGNFLSMVTEKAVKMAESNACMRRIVAAPTAGACGVIPAVLLTYEEKKEVSEDRLVEALFVAGGIGEILARNASIAGAEGG